MNAVLFLLSLSVLINYIDRSNLSISAEMIKGELRLSDLQLGTLLSAFFWVYGLMQIPAGWLADHFDVKWVFAIGFFLWSGATAVTALMHGFAALIAIRIVLGIGESVAFPSYSNILSTHFSQARRGRANGAIIAGLALGPAIGMLVGGTLVGRFGWRPFFLVLGLGSLLWLIPWMVLMPKRVQVAAHVAGVKISILDIVRQRSAWGTMLGQFAVNYCLYFLVTWLPSYLTRGRHFSMDQMARTGGLIFLLFAISAIVSGKLSDRYIEGGGSTTVARKTQLGAGMVGQGIALAVAAVAPDTIFVWALMAVGIAMGTSSACTWTVAQTLGGPRAAGRWAGVQNFIGNFAGGVGPMLTGYLVGLTGKFYWPFFIAAMIAWMGAVGWVFVVGPIETVDWEKECRAPRFGIVAPAADGARP